MITNAYSRKIYISTNSTCNLQCVYCFEKEKRKFEFSVTAAIDLLENLLKTKTPHGTQISLRGGEPFMVFPKIKQLCESLWAKSLDEYYHFHITTNGTLIHGEILEWLDHNSNKITLKLSLDGDKWTSDINRPKSFDLIDFEFLIRKWPEMKINMTVTSETVPYLSNNVKFIHSLGFRHVLSHFSIMTHWETCKLEKTLYSQLLDLADYYLQHPNIEPCNFLNRDISRTLTIEPDFTPCNHGQIAYDFQTRKYYPCYMCFPSVGGEKVAEEFRKLDFSDLKSLVDDGCCECPFINICLTRYAENYILR